MNFILGKMLGYIIQPGMSTAGGLGKVSIPLHAISAEG